MQLKWKKIGILSTFFVYCASFLIQSNFVLFQTWAQEVNIPRVNIVAILVDDKIYKGIEDGLNWYASDYIQNKLADSKALVIPLDLTNIKAYDIYRMMENIYFDGLENTNSSLIGLIMFGDIPLPVINQDSYIFPSVYPYVDFENQKYVRDEESQYFVSNNNPRGQAEIRHGLINYGDDISAYKKFFEKVRKYYTNPDEFIGDSMWYEDFIAQKEAFLNEDYQYYRNKIMFGEDIGYQRYSSLMKSMFGGESVDNSMEIISDLSDNMDVDFEGFETLEEMLSEGKTQMHTTKMVQQEIETSYLADYNEIFSKNISSTIRENIFAGGRWIKLYNGEDGKTSQIVDADSSAQKIQLKDTMYLGNDDLQGLLENMNMLMEEMIDKKIDKNRYDMDIVVPVSFKQISGKRMGAGLFRSSCVSFVSRFDNYYFGNNARYVNKASDLSVYRGTYRNISDLSGVTIDSLKEGNNPIVSAYDPVNIRFKSIGASYGIFSNQAEGNKGYYLLGVERDLDVYDEEKTTAKSVKYRERGRVKRREWEKDCDDDSKNRRCETLFDFAQRWWGGASTINLDEESVSKGRYEIKGYTATGAWRSIFDMQGFQSLLSGDDEGMLGTGWVNGTGTGPQWAATSFKAYIKYSSPTQREGWGKLSRRKYVIYNNHLPDVHISFDEMDYRKLPISIINRWNFEKESTNIFNITNRTNLNRCRWLGNPRVLSEQYTYNVIRSIVKHTSTTEDEINGIDRDKYGETGTLGQYYRDVKKSYEDIQNDLSDVLDGLKSLESSISGVNEYIETKIKNLNSKGDELSDIVNDLNQLQSSLTDLETQLQDAESQKTQYNEQLDGLKNDLKILDEQLEAADEEEKYDIQIQIDGINEEITGVESSLESVNEIISTLQGQIPGLKSSVDSKKGEKDNTEDAILALLSGVSENVKSENVQLSDIYKLVTALFVDNITTVLEYIVYMEGGNPDGFYDGEENAYKVGFLASRISEIKKMESGIKSDSNKIIDYYETVYDLIEQQQTLWGQLADKLSNLDLNEKTSKKIEEISSSMNEIFVVDENDTTWKIDGDDESFRSDLVENFDKGEDGEENDGEEDSSITTLTKTTAVDAIKGEGGLIDGFQGEFGVDAMFSWTITEDEVGAAIIKAAKDDNDFLLWLYENEIGQKKPSNTLLQKDFESKFLSRKQGFLKSGKFSDVDWINQYAQWAKGPGLDSKGAEQNRDLLDGVIEHMAGMNILTPDRPIDSPRYISMQSVAGNDMKFIYPDLFKVEVYVLTGKNKSGYDIHELLPPVSLTGLDIKKNLEKYLKGKVLEYNAILTKECGAAREMSSYYKRLYDLGYKEATPDVLVHHCSTKFTYEEFLEALGGEEMLETISYMLYYQNLTNKKKLSSLDVAEDIDFIKQSFTLNDKREEILDDYLIQGQDEKKSPIFVIPTYESLGYEVGFVNSNGRDYIIPEDANTEEITGLTKSSKNQSSLLKIVRRQPTQQEGDYNDECNIPKNGRLPLFKLNGLAVSSPWFEGFKCWLKKTIEEPVKVKLTFDNSLGEILAADSLGDYIKNSEFGQYFTDYGDAWTRYGDQWDEIIDPDKDHDSDVEITQMQVEAEKHNQEAMVGNTADAATLRALLSNIKVTNPTTLLSDNTPSSELMISSFVDLGNITVVFAGTGDGCLKLDGKALCNGDSVTKVFNPKSNPFIGVVESADHIAGKTALDIKISLGNNYMKHVIKYTVSPSTIESIKIVPGDDKTIAGMLTPVEIIGNDKYGNRVLWGMEKYNFTVSQGEFLKDGSYQKSFTTNDFRNLRFYYHAPLNAEDNSEAVIQISKASDPNVYKATYRQRVVQAAPEVKLNGTVILKGKNDLLTNQTYRLKDDESIYVGDKLAVSKLQRLDVEMKDPSGKIVDVDSQILVTSQNGLVVVGQVQKDEKGNDVFFETSKNYMKSGYATIYYYPTTVAGEDKINIDIPGLDTRVINLSVKPSSLIGIQIVPEDDVVEIGKIIDVELFGFDVWGNLVDGIRNVSIGFDDDKIQFLEDPSAEDILHTSLDNGYRKLRVLGLEGGLTYLIEGSTYTPLYVDKHIFPDSGLNIMYLNYFGDDWGNQWGYFSDNNKYIENVMKKSNKVIVTTTQLVSEDKIKKMIWKIQPGFNISNPDNTTTIMTMNGNTLDVLIGGVSTMHVNLPSMQWMSVPQDTMYDLLSGSKSASNSYIFFIPSDEKYKIKDGKLYNDGELVLNVLGGEATFQLTSPILDNGDNIWSLVDRGINYGKLVIHYPRFQPRVSNFSVPGERYVVNETFTNGSTDSLSSVGIFDELSDFELDSNYKSIQNSDEVKESIGFLGDFKNITLFAEGETVGEATKKYGSEFVINLGDPVLSRKDKNEVVKGTNFDGGIGNEIFVDSEDDIFGTYQIKFDGDGDEDLLVVYKNGKIKLSKNYGGTPDLRNMQELMRIAIDIQDVFVGDADGNGYDDILVLSKNNQLRAYLNHGGVFDVDGSLACINQDVFEGEISEHPDKLEGIFQLFVEDMNLDKYVDIITYDDKGYIKVFYGGTTDGGPNYLSTKNFTCDTGWYNREIKNTTVVAAFGVQVVGDDIFDNSLMHWVGMEQEKEAAEKARMNISQSELSKYGVYFDPNSLADSIKSRKRHEDSSIKAVTSDIMGNFDVNQAGQQYVDEGMKFVDVSLYENVLELDPGHVPDRINNYVFAPSSFLDPMDPKDKCSVRKNYRVNSGSSILQDGDVITVRVTVKASDLYPCRGSYADVIQGPWNLYFDEDEIFKGIRFISTDTRRNAVVKKRDGNYAYIMDNITLKPAEKLIFEYDLEYHHLPLKKMSISYKTYWSNDNYPDIKMQSADGCAKDFDVYINRGKEFLYNLIPLQEMIDEEYLQEEEKTDDYGADIVEMGSNANSLPGIVGNRIDRVSLLSNLGDAIRERLEAGGLEGLNVNFDVNLSLFGEQADKIESVIDDITKGMCNGFSFGGSSNCKGLPVPFNQAFLAPGKYHLFGCWELPVGPLEGGIPMFFFPGNLRVGTFELPIPNAMKGPLDNFLWVPGGTTYNSWIRIYAAPTLTAQLGIAICMGNSKIASKLKSPLADIAGNCIVFAVKPQCKGDTADASRQSDPDNPNEVYGKTVEDVRDSGVCKQFQKGFMVTLKGNRSAPFNLYSYRTKVSDSGNRNDFSWKETGQTIWGGDDSFIENVVNNADVSGGHNYGVQYSASFMGIIDLETDSYIGRDEDFEDNTQNSIVIGDVDILGGDFSVNKIRGGLQQGVRKLLIDKWLDPQIRYILNQLTKMHINIKFPDVSNMVDNEVQTIKNVAENFGDLFGGDNKGWYKPDFLTSWSNNTQANLNTYNKAISNPFESLASLMNESNIINISMEPITVKIPWIFNEDIEAYKVYLQQRLDVNKGIIDDWYSILKALVTSCSKKETPEEQEACRIEAQENLSAFIEFEQGDWQKMLNQIQDNLMILQKYRNFPFEVYERIHVIDRYMAEIASLINNTIGYLAYWTSTNSERFVGYVDAIVLILNIIKTYQLLIDFSIEWGENCGNCSKDTYDQYSCKLSMLCDMIKLPIIQIPNFKLPNITIDLTNIDIGLDIVLPEFNFQPVRVNLPDIPNLPQPPSIGINIKFLDLPNIPKLPEPPELPELPSFIPEVELELPMLPPAPEVPKLPNSIEGVIRIAKLIGKIYCIVKGGFGLVGESSVKAKIEQLTQRTYEVKWIDTIMDFTNRSAAPIKHYGVDYEIDSYVDLHFNFTVFYDYLDTLAKSINNLTTTSVNRASKQANKYVNENPVVDVANKADGVSIGANVNILSYNDVDPDEGVDTDLSFLKNVDIDGIPSDDIEYVDYNSGKARLKDVLTFFRQETTNTTMGDSVISSLNKIENQIDKSNNIAANLEGLEDLRGEVNDYLNKERLNYSELADLINNDYDSFLAMVGANYSSGNNKSSYEGEKLLTFNTQLFNLDSSTKETINSISKSNPYEILVNNKKTIIDGYWNAINTNSAADLGLTDSQYLVLRNNISSMRNQVNALYSLTKPASPTNLVAKDSGKFEKKSLVAGLRMGDQTEVATVVDPSILSNGIFEKILGTAGTELLYTKVIYSYSFSEAMKDSYYHTTHDDNHDIVLWDENAIYKKCNGQSCIRYGGTYKGYYASKTVKEIPYVETWLSFPDGMKLKIADKNEEIKNWKVIGQTYDVLSFSWKKSDVDAYLIKLVERIDHSYEKADYTSKASAHYVLVLPNTTNLGDVYEKSTRLELLNKKIDTIKNLYGKDLVEVAYYDPYKSVFNVSISNIDRKWYYARVSALNLSGNTYYIDSPWSNQVVAGRQIVGDDQAPSGYPKLYRPTTKKVVSDGDDLEGYVGTNYELIIDWKDNVALSYINLMKDGKILDEKYTSAAEDSVSTKIKLHTKSEKEIYTTMGIDQYGHKTEKVVTVSYYIPDITITDLSKNADGETIAITAELSQDIDQGNVSFQRRRGEVRKSMIRTGLDCADIPIGPEQTLVIGTPYSAGNDIAMYDKNGEVMALIDPDTGEIKLQSGYVNKYEINVEVKDSPVLRFCNKGSNNSIFSISLPSDEQCIKIETDGYSVVDLPEEGKMGMFNGGKAVYNKDGINVLYISPECYLYSDLSLKGTYAYDKEVGGVMYTLYEPSDYQKKNPIKVWFKVKPLLFED